MTTRAGDVAQGQWRRQYLYYQGAAGSSMINIVLALTCSACSLWSINNAVLRVFDGKVICIVPLSGRRLGLP